MKYPSSWHESATVFSSEPYNDDDISHIVRKRELFFLETPLRINRPGSKLYKQFLAFDRPFPCRRHPSAAEAARLCRMNR